MMHIITGINSGTVNVRGNFSIGFSGLTIHPWLSSVFDMISFRPYDMSHMINSISYSIG